MAEAEKKMVAGHAEPRAARLTDLVADIASGTFGQIHDRFHSHELAAPQLIWNPREVDLRHPTVQSFYKLCRRASDAESHCKRLSFELQQLDDLQRNLMLLSVEEAGADFRYLHYGAAIAEVYGADMTGKYTSEIGGVISEFFLSVYRAVLLRRQWILTVHEPPPTVFVQTWRRLIVPLFELTGEIRRIAAINVPDNDLTAGLDAIPDPVVLVREDGIMQYANKAAVLTFGREPRKHVPHTLESYTGIVADLSRLFDLEERSPTVYACQTVSLLERLIVHFEVTAMPITYRGKRLAVVVMKPS